MMDRPPPRMDLVLRWVLSLVSGLGLAALTLVVLWVGVHLLGLRPWRRVRDDDLALGLGVAGIIWLVALSRIWAGAWRGGRPEGVMRGVCWTLAIAMAAVVGGVIIEEWVRGDEELLVAAWVLALGGIAAAVWIPILRSLAARRSVLTAEQIVDVRCPKCGYSLVGLCELRCPECGEQFTIDGLIHAQNYDGARPIAFRPPADGASATAPPADAGCAP